MRVGKPVCLLLLAVSLLAVLTACSGASAVSPTPGPGPSQEPTPVPAYTVSFFAPDGSLLHRETVQKGCSPAAFTAELDGLRLLDWMTEEAEPTTPFANPIEGTTSYFADCAPALSVHAPYLFQDAHALIRPDDDLTCHDFARALYALGNGNAERFFPEVCSGYHKITRQVFFDTLSVFFPEETFDVGDGGAPLTRAEAAVILNPLLGRGEGERPLPAEDARLAPDLDPARPEYAALLEAYVPHDPDGGAADGGLDTDLAAPFEPGFLLVDGALYAIGEDGRFQRDTDLGVLHFGADGRYTSGSDELDGHVRRVLANLALDHPEATREELLRLAYEYARDSFTYLRRPPYAMRATGWEIDDAVAMFTKLHGNCYSYASVFWALARGLGYEAVAFSGTITETYQPHAWVEITFDDEPYIFDAEMEMAYHLRNIFDRDMFMLDYPASRRWRYNR